MSTTVRDSTTLGVPIDGGPNYPVPAVVRQSMAVAEPIARQFFNYVRAKASPLRVLIVGNGAIFTAIVGSTMSGKFIAQGSAAGGAGSIIMSDPSLAQTITLGVIGLGFACVNLAAFALHLKMSRQKEGEVAGLATNPAVPLETRRQIVVASEEFAQPEPIVKLLPRP